MFDFLAEWGVVAQDQQKHYVQRWEKGYSFIEPATGTNCWFCERDSWRHDLVIPRNSLLAKIVNVWPYRLKDIMFLTTGRDAEVKVTFLAVMHFDEKEELDSDYICFNNVELKQVPILDAFEKVGKLKDMLLDKSFITHFPTLVENFNNAFKKIKKYKATKKTQAY